MSASRSYEVQSPTEPDEAETKPDETETEPGEARSNSVPQQNESVPSRTPSRSTSVSTASQADLPVESKPISEKFLNWTKQTFDWNVGYIKSVRGVSNILTLVFSFLGFSILAAACQMKSVDNYAGFYCKSSDTFLFVILCCAFITSSLLVACCIFSINSDEKLRGSSFEVTYYFAFCALFLTSSLILMSNVSLRNKGKVEYEYRYGHVVTGSILGLMCCITYGINSIWFIINHRKNRNSSYSA